MSNDGQQPTRPGHRPYSWITRALAVGGCFADADVPFILSEGITCVVDLREEDRDNEALLRDHGIRFLHLPTRDDTAVTLESLRVGSDWVLDRLSDGARVLIHCQYGIGRSVMLACGVLARMGYTADDALVLVHAHRPVAAPNKMQMAILRRFCTSYVVPERSLPGDRVEPAPARG